MRSTLAAFIERFDPGEGRPLVACSGGADSLALLALTVVTCDHPDRAVAVFVDHGLRPTSRADGEFVVSWAQAQGISAEIVDARVEAGPNVEERARDARRTALLEEADRQGAAAVLLGHTMDDQAETVLLHILRGGALAGLAGMPERDGRIVRPLLRFRRAETAEICRLVGVDPRHDTMNDDRSYRRVWVRHEALPNLSAGVERDLVPVLARQAEIARDDLAYLDAAADEIVHAARREDGNLDAATVCHAPRALARRALRRWIGPPAPDAARLEDALDVARGAIVAVQIGGGREVRRSGGRLRLHRIISEEPTEG